MEKMQEISQEKQKEKNKSELFVCKLIVASIFAVFAIMLYLLNVINIPALCLIFAGVLWNFFVDINTFLAFLLALVVGVIYAMFSIIDGLYINALLYTIYYIPLQFIVWIMNLNSKDMSIRKDKKLSKNSIYYICVLCIFSVVACFAFALLQQYQILPLFDAVTATMLGLCAFLQSLMFREYYIVKPIALVLALSLWIYVGAINGWTIGALTIIMLYAMYLVLDIITMVFWLKTIPAVDKERLEVLDNDGHKTLVNEKMELYHKSSNKDDFSDKDDNVIA